MNTLPEGYSFGGLISTTMAPTSGAQRSAALRH